MRVKHVGGIHRRGRAPHLGQHGLGFVKTAHQKQDPRGKLRSVCWKASSLPGQSKAVQLCVGFARGYGFHIACWRGRTPEVSDRRRR
jgi:hypothetical protein